MADDGGSLPSGSEAARWWDLYEQLRRQIEEGHLNPGDHIPPERELVAQTQFSRATVRRALRELEQAGLIMAGAGSKGRTVRQRFRIEFDMSKFELGAYVDDPEQGIDQWKAGVRNAGWTDHQVVAGVDQLPAPRDIAEFLDVDPGQVVVRRRRLRSISKPDQGIPEMVAMIADTWTPMDIAEMKVNGRAPLLSPDDTTLPGGIYHALGFRQVKFIDRISARMPTDEETELMGLPPGTAVGQHARIGIDTTGRRVRVLVQTWAGDRQEITYEHDVPERRLPGDSQ
ncbi:GntR family transcriptional regulator [Kribbella sp. NPDC020789]